MSRFGNYAQVKVGMKTFRDLMIGLMCLCFGIAAVHIIKIFEKIEYDLNVVSSQVYYISNSVHEVTEKLKTTVDTANATLQQVKAASAEERTALEAQNKRALDVLEQTETALINLQLAVDDIDKNTGKVSEASVQAVNKLEPLLVESTNAVKNAGILFADPKLKETFAHLSTTTDNLAATTGNIEHSTKQIDNKITEMLKPASFIKRILGEAMGWFGHIGDIRKALDK
jgi:hypothetical protein